MVIRVQQRHDLASLMLCHWNIAPNHYIKKLPTVNFPCILRIIAVEE